MCFQDDIMMGTLTVRENLLFSANLRLNPQHYSSTDKNSKVDAIIQDLGLTDCANTKVQCYIQKLIAALSLTIHQYWKEYCKVLLNLKDSYFTKLIFLTSLTQCNSVQTIK